MSDQAWLSQIPYGGYQDARGLRLARAAQARVHGSVYAPFRPAPYSPYDRSPYVGQYPPPGMTAPAPDAERSIFDVFGITLLGLGVFGGVGALTGWLIGGTQQAALIGALVGISAPPAASALLYMQQGQGGPPR